MKALKLFLLSILSLGLLSCSKNESPVETPKQVAPTTPPSIVSQPSSLIVEAGLRATFTVSATGTAPISYQWKKNGIIIAGANASIFAIDTVVQADSGAVFSVVVSNSAGSTTSSPATLAVQTVLALGRPYLGGTIFWLDPVRPGHGLVAANYDQTNGNSVPTLEAAQMLCKNYNGHFRLPDTTEIRVLKAAKQAGIVTGFISPQLSPSGLYGTSVVWNTTPPGFLHLPFNREGNFGWAGAYINIRAVRSF